jgi:uncharacterized membrane-anchored protein YitT (DUF2179 family)
MKKDSFVWNLEFKRIFAVIFFTFVYAVGVLWFIEASVVPMYTGGVLGIAQLFRDTLFVVFDQTTGIAFLATVNMILNIPILILGWKGVSHRFTIYTLISIVFQTLFLSLIPRVDFGLSEQVHVFAASTLGGLLIGIGAGGALRYGASTGGIDIIAQYVSLKSGKSVGFISLVVNIVVAILGAFIIGGQVGPSGVTVAGGIIVSYTIVRIIASTIGLDLVHTSYQHISVQIISNQHEAIAEQIIHTIRRGVTYLEAQGAYSKSNKMMIYVIISRYEFETLFKLIQKIDPKAFIVTTPVRSVYGNFLRKTMA